VESLLSTAQSSGTQGLGDANGGLGETWLLLAWPGQRLTLDKSFHTSACFPLAVRPTALHTRGFQLQYTFLAQ